MSLKIRIFLLSFTLLFLELSLIRWIPAQIRLAAYFSNLILLGSFFGMGLGFLFTRIKRNFFPFLPLLMVLLFILTTSLQISIDASSKEVIFFMTYANAIPLSPEFILPTIFFITAGLFLTLGQQLGKAFVKLSPLTAYSLDILGAIAGVVFFTLLSYFYLPAPYWFLIIGVCFIVLSSQKTLKNPLLWLCLITAIIIPFLVNKNSLWSPYYKITLAEEPGALHINVNDLGHQIIEDSSKLDRFYFAPYDELKRFDYKQILIVGGGVGNDTAVALKEAPQANIDVVEIDPVIINLGKNLHPNHPFSSPRVHIYNTDARGFLERTDKKYDLIIFALTDSLTINARSNIRLESFLFTKEAFVKAKEHLNPNGIFAAYNYYRENWLVNKIFWMLNDSFGRKPYVHIYDYIVKSAIFITGTGNLSLPPSSLLKQATFTKRYPVATDDWPFLYLKHKTIPSLYLNSIAIILSLCSIIILATKKYSNIRFLNVRFFLLGAGFMLLETKSLINFALLFGNTWLVNSLVISSILVSVLAANILSMKISINKLVLLACLLLTLILNLILPSSFFSGLADISRYALASLLYFSPVFFANLLFSQIFKDIKDSDFSFGSNLIGIMFGGFLEYLALIFGYKSLIILIALFYFMALFKIKPKYE